MIVRHGRVIAPNIDAHVRSRLINLVLIIYWLLIFEGALRKWAFPELHQYLYFIRDPFVLLIYWHVFKSRLFPRDVIFKVMMGLALAMLPIMFVQLYLQDTPIEVLVVGWRNYFLYVPLSFVIGELFERDDLMRVLKRSLIIGIPMAILVFIQFMSPPDSFINKGIGDEGFIMQVVENIVRTTGTFTFTAGQSFYCGSLFAMLAYVWILPSKYRPLVGWALWLCSFSVVAMISLSGSRTVFFFVILVLLFSIASGLLSANKYIRKRAIYAPLWILAFGTIIFVTVFSDSFDAMLARQQDAVSNEGSTLVRAFSAFYQFLSLAEQAPIFGYGIGSGSAGGVSLLQGGSEAIVIDDEWSRMVMENGLPFALIYIFIRIALALKLLKGALRSLRKTGDPLGLILMSFILMPLVNGSITTQGTINGYVWIFCGFCMAASKVQQNGGRSY